MEFSPQAKFICPHCQDSFALSSDSTHSIAFCPHCSRELFIAELETKVGSTSHGQVESTIPALQNIGRDYEILDLLGRGGMGAVYKARQNSLNREVAIKILPPSLSEESHFVQRFQRESDTMAALDHPGIVKVLDRGQVGDLYYFVMEYIEGRTLQEILKEEKLPWRRSCEILINILDGLEYAHDKGVVHRDIKPGNILMGKDQSLKISDFGLARLLAGSTVAGQQTITDLTATEMVLGTLRYMAPEQRASSKGVDHRVDLFALGVMAYEMFTSKEPSGRFALPSQVNPDLPIGLDWFIEKALQPDPEDRFSSASEMMDKLRDILEGREDPLEKKAQEQPREGKSKKEIAVKFLLGSQIGCSIAVTLSLAFILLIPLWSKLYQGERAETAKSLPGMGDRKATSQNKSLGQSPATPPKEKKEDEIRPPQPTGPTLPKENSQDQGPLQKHPDGGRRGQSPSEDEDPQDVTKDRSSVDLLQKASAALSLQSRGGRRFDRGRRGEGLFGYRELLFKKSQDSGWVWAREGQGEKSSSAPDMIFLLRARDLLKRIGFVKKTESIALHGSEAQNRHFRKALYLGMAFQAQYLTSASDKRETLRNWAQRCYQEATRLQPWTAEPYFLQAFLYRDSGDFRRYWEFLSLGLALDRKGYGRALKWYGELKR